MSIEQNDKEFINLICNSYNKTRAGVLVVSDEAFDQTIQDRLVEDRYYSVVYLNDKKLHVYDLFGASEEEAGIAALFASENRETMTYTFICDEGVVYGIGNKLFSTKHSYANEHMTEISIFVGDNRICSTLMMDSIDEKYFLRISDEEAA